MSNLKDGRPSFADRLRRDIATLRAEAKTQDRCIARILGASAQIAINQDNLIREVADTLKEDLE